MSQSKRLKTGDLQSADVLYGPVDTNGNPRAIGKSCNGASC